jgi:membrane protease YdiL (CAAX protease family)
MMSDVSHSVPEHGTAQSADSEQSHLTTGADAPSAAHSEPNSLPNIDDQARSISTATAQTEIWIELAVVLAFAVLPNLYYEAMTFFLRSESVSVRRLWTDEAIRSPSLRWSDVGNGLIRKAGIISVLLFIMWNSRQPWSHFGLTLPRWETDIVLGMGIFLVYALVRNGATILVATAFGKPHGDLFFGVVPAPTPPPVILLLLAYTAAIGFTEELIFRGYLIPRLE